MLQMQVQRGPFEVEDSQGLYEEECGKRTWANEVSKLVFGVLSVVTGLLVVCVITLFVLIQSNRNSASSSLTPNAAALTSLLPSISSGLGVSFTKAGSLQQGAGTTFHVNVLPSLLGTIRCPEYVSLAAFSNNSYVVAYASGTSTTAAASLVAVRVGGTQPGVADFVGPVLQSNLPIFQVATLATTSTHTSFVVLCQQVDYSNPSGPAVVLSGSVDHTTYIITLGSVVTYSIGNSFTPSLVVLSSNSFAIAYYTSGSPTYVATRYGLATPSSSITGLVTPSISLSAEYVVPSADDRNYSINFELAALSPTTYLLAYYDGNDDTAYNKLLPQVGVLKVVPFEVSSKIGTQVAGAVVALPSTKATGFFAMTALSSTEVLVAYVDKARNNGISVLALHFISSPIATVLVTSTLAVTTGSTLIPYAGGVNMAIDLTIISNSEIGIIYADVGNSNAITISRVRYSPSKDLYTPVEGPNVVITAGNPNIAIDKFGNPTYYAWGAAASTRTTPMASQAAFLVVQGEYAQCSAGVYAKSTLTVLEVLPPLLGVAQGAGGVAMRGTASVSTGGLIPGNAYYTTSTGVLVSGGLAGWSQCLITAASDAAKTCPGTDYVAAMLGDREVLVLESNSVGIALSASALLI